MRRLIDILWSIIAAAALVWLNVDERLWTRISDIAREQRLQRYLTIPTFLAGYFLCWMILMIPLSIRRRMSAVQWYSQMLRHGLMFVIGGSLLMIYQILSAARWERAFQIILLILVLATRYIAFSDAACGGQQALRPSRRVLLSILAWIWLIAGVAAAARQIPPKLVGSPLFVAHLAAWMTAWVGGAIILTGLVFPLFSQQILRTGPWCASLASNPHATSRMSNVTRASGPCMEVQQ